MNNVNSKLSSLSKRFVELILIIDNLLESIGRSSKGFNNEATETDRLILIVNYNLFIVERSPNRREIKKRLDDLKILIYRFYDLLRGTRISV